MTRSALSRVLIALVGACLPSGWLFAVPTTPARPQPQGIVLQSRHLVSVGEKASAGTLTIDGLYYVTAEARTELPVRLAVGAGLTTPATQVIRGKDRTVRVSVQTEGDAFTIRLSAEPADDILRWGLGVSSAADEYYTGLMERVVDGPQDASWAPFLEEAMNLRGQKVDMIVKPTTSVYAPFYLSSRNHAVWVKGNWPGAFDFCVDDPQRVKIQFEGPSFEMKAYTAADPMALVRAHAMDAGPAFLPPKWMYTPWRWRDEHSQLKVYYDGTAVTGPFNSQLMEDVLMMRAYGIPNGVYWVDRPWAPGRMGYDDFEIDATRLPHFGETIKWLNDQQMKMVLWIGPFFQGEMEREALAKGYNLAGQPPQPNNYPMVDLTNPEAKAYWQDGVAKLLKLGVAGFKLDRGEENIPEKGPFKVFDGRSIRENRNAYPAMYLKATYDVAKQHRGDDFVLMPRAAYSGSAPYGVFWGGDVAGTQEGLRASIVAVQRSSVMGYPNWGSDTCGYARAAMEQEVCGRWLAFSAFTPIMEVGPTRNLAFWSLPRTPSYDPVLIAIWRLYARVHQRLVDYSYEQAQLASRDGTPIVRPLFLADPAAPEAWSNWWTYLYGPDLLVSPIWKKNTRYQTVYLPAGHEWRDAWRPEDVYKGGQEITVPAELHQIPLFVRVGSSVDLGDLEAQYAEALAVAEKRPDLKALDAEVAAWFAKLPR